MSVAQASRSAARVHGLANTRLWRWEQVGLAVLLAATAAMFLWGLDRNGWANPYYSAAAQAGSQDWKAFFYGSLDAGNLITVDKPPLSIWIMSLSVRLFGLNTWALLVPQALMGVATTWLIYKIIRRSHSAAPALLGGLIYATTPVVVLMSRYNNPEPLMGLLTVAAVYFVLRAIEDNRWAWYLLAGTSLGLGFMAKQLQALLPFPALILAVIILGTGTVGSRILRLLGCFVALIISGGWWMTIVELVPPEARPYIGGSVGNSALQLTTGYNGLGRFTQFTNENGVPVASENHSLLGTFQAGVQRLFNADFAQESAWLLFPALCCSAILLILQNAPSQGRMSVSSLVATVWLVTVFGVLCFAGTMVHSYYSFSLAQPMAIVLALGLQHLWHNRERTVTRLIGSVVIASASYMSIRIMDYSDSWPPLCSTFILVAGSLATVLWALPNLAKKTVCVPLALALVLGPVTTNLYTINRAEEGTNPLSGPTSKVVGSLSQRFAAAKEGKDPRSLQIAFGSPPDTQLVSKLSVVGNDQKWAAVTLTAQNAALYQLASQKPVAALGGWLGLDPAPTLAQFQDLVANGRIGFLIDQPSLLAEQKIGKETTAIVYWVRDNFTADHIGREVVYDLRRK